MIQHVSGIKKNSNILENFEYSKGDHLRYATTIVYDNTNMYYNEHAKCFMNRIYNAINNEKLYVEINIPHYWNKHITTKIHITYSNISTKNIHHFKLLYTDNDRYPHMSEKFDIRVLYNDMNDENERKKYILDNDIPLLSLLIQAGLYFKY